MPVKRLCARYHIGLLRIRLFLQQSRTCVNQLTLGELARRRDGGRWRGLRKLRIRLDIARRRLNGLLGWCSLRGLRDRWSIFLRNTNDLPHKNAIGGTDIVESEQCIQRYGVSRGNLR